MVWSLDAKTGEIALKSVAGVIRRHPREIWEVEISDGNGQVELFETTNDHPWWVHGRGWVVTAELSVGEYLKTKTGSFSEIQRIERTNRQEYTYNLSVTEFETYFVGEQKILVHNCSKILRALDGVPWGQYCRTGCEDVATKIHGAIGGTIHRIAPFPVHKNLKLGKRNGQATEWFEHEVVVKNGRVYDALTGPEGLTIEEFKKAWEYHEAIDFGF